MTYPRGTALRLNRCCAQAAWAAARAFKVTNDELGGVYILCTVGIACCEDEGPVSANGIWLKGKKTEDENSRE